MLAKSFMVSSWITKAPTEGDPKDPEAPWNFYAPPALMDKPDYDKQTLVKAGILSGLRMWEKLGGHFDYAHMYRKTLDPKYLIAVRKGMADVDGMPNVVGELYKSEEKPLAKSVWSHLLANGPIGLSIEGIIKALDPKNKNRVLDTEIHFITIDPAPKGFDGTRMRPGLPPTYGELTKSLTAELDRGDVDDWLEIDSLELVPVYSAGLDPYSIMSPGAFLKAITAGAGGGHGPGESGFGATMREEFLRKGGNAERRVPQCKCKECGKSQSIKRQRCIGCGKSMKARS